MRIAFLCKRRYMSKDVILDRYARLYEIPYQLARLGHEVHGYCLDYHASSDGIWMHDAAPGSLEWTSRSLGKLRVPALAAYPYRLLGRLRTFKPDVIIGASDIPHVALAAWLAHRLDVPHIADLYDNFEGFGQARIPGFVTALRHATRSAALVTTTSEPLKKLVEAEYRAKGKIVAMPSSVDKSVFKPMDKAACRKKLGLPANVQLVGTAGGLYRDKGIEPLYAAWTHIAAKSDAHLVLAGPSEAGFAPPQDERVHYLGNLSHDQVAELFCALDVGVISILDTRFGRYCFPQKAYEMLACRLPVAAADVGAMSDLLADSPQQLFQPGNAAALSDAVLRALEQPHPMDLPIRDWEQLVREIEPLIRASTMRTAHRSR